MSGNAGRGSCQPWQVLRKASPIRAPPFLRKSGASGYGVLSGRPFGTEIILPSATVYGSFFIPKVVF